MSAAGYKPSAFVKDLHQVDYFGSSVKPAFSPFTPQYKEYLHTISNVVLVVALVCLVFYTFVVYSYVFGSKRGKEISNFDCTFLTPAYYGMQSSDAKYNVTRIRSRGGRPLRVTLAIIFALTFVVGVHAYQYQEEMTKTVDAIRNETMLLSRTFVSAQANGRVLLTGNRQLRRSAGDAHCDVNTEVCSGAHAKRKQQQSNV